MIGFFPASIIVAYQANYAAVAQVNQLLILIQRRHQQMGVADLSDRKFTGEETNYQPGDTV